jgi:chemotaxis protein CheC
MFRPLDATSLDALREVATVGAGHAATALAQMTGHHVRLSLPTVSSMPLSEVPVAIGGEETPVAALHLRVYGDVRANALLTFPPPLGPLLRPLTGHDPSGVELTELERSALLEVGNVLCSAYLSAISRLLGITMIPTVPGLAFDMVGAVVDFLLVETGETSDEALVLETALLGTEDGPGGRFFLLPHPDGLAALLRAIGRRSS